MSDKTIFIAGGFHHRVQIAEKIRKAAKLGWTVTHDWTQKLTDNTHRAHSATAKTDAEAIFAANVVVAIMDDPTYEYKGTFTELGMAIGMNLCGKKKAIYIVNPVHSRRTAKCQRNVYYAHEFITAYFETWDAFEKAILITDSQQ